MQHFKRYFKDNADDMDVFFFSSKTKILTNLTIIAMVNFVKKWELEISRWSMLRLI